MNIRNPMRGFHRFLIALLLLPGLFPRSPLAAGADGRGPAVISEIAWAGSDLSTADEWVELFAPAGTDLSGWTLTTRRSDGTEEGMVVFPDGFLTAADRFVVVSNYGPGGASRLAIEPDIVTTAVSLPNGTLALRLYDADGALADAVGDGGAPYAGDNAGKASMERVDLFGDGMNPLNWATAQAQVNITVAFGTPGAARVLDVDTGEPDPSQCASACPVPGECPGTGAACEDGLDEQYGDATDVDAGSAATGAAVASAGAGTVSSVIGELGQTMQSGQPGPSLPSILFSVSISEILPNPKGSDDEEWMEIVNDGADAVDLAGFAIAAGSRSFPFASGTVLGTGEYRAFRKSVTGLTLANKGGEVRLFFGAAVIDALSWPEAGEGISFGPERAYCIPTESKPNDERPLPVEIGVQSGDRRGVERVSLNLEARTAEGSLDSAECSWNFGDGSGAGSCNPPSHAFDNPGSFLVELFVETACGDIIEQSMLVQVERASSVSSSPKTSSSAKSSKSSGSFSSKRPSSQASSSRRSVPGSSHSNSSSSSGVARATSSAGSVSAAAPPVPQSPEGVAGILRIRYVNVVVSSASSDGSVPPGYQFLLAFQDQLQDQPLPEAEGGGGDGGFPWGIVWKSLTALVLLSPSVWLLMRP